MNGNESSRQSKRQDAISQFGEMLRANYGFELSNQNIAEIVDTLVKYSRVLIEIQEGQDTKVRTTEQIDE